MIYGHGGYPTRFLVDDPGNVVGLAGLAQLFGRNVNKGLAYGLCGLNVVRISDAGVPDTLYRARHGRLVVLGIAKTYIHEVQLRTT